MKDEALKNNIVSLSGKVASGLTFSHQFLGENFYTMEMNVKRLSGFTDRIPLMIPEYFKGIIEDHAGEKLKVSGQFCSYNDSRNTGSRLRLYVLAKNIIAVEENTAFENEIVLGGYLCKAPVYRKTPLGKEITDLMLAVNRPYGKSDYIPCICWGKNSREACGCTVGEFVRIKGRIQSRTYVKRLGGGKIENRLAYEVSANTFISCDDSGWM